MSRGKTEKKKTKWARQATTPHQTDACLLHIVIIQLQVHSPPHALTHLNAHLGDLFVPSHMLSNVLLKWVHDFDKQYSTLSHFARALWRLNSPRPSTEERGGEEGEEGPTEEVKHAPSFCWMLSLCPCCSLGQKHTTHLTHIVSCSFPRIQIMVQKKRKRDKVAKRR